MRPRSDPEVAEWFEKAGEDLETVEILKNYGPHLGPVMAFHCQQASEKALKGLCVALGFDPPRTHDLDDVSLPLLAVVPTLGGVRDDLTYLKGFAVLPRYPAFQQPARDPYALGRRAEQAVKRVIAVVEDAFATNATESDP